jgi:hypothetical protein
MAKEIEDLIGSNIEEDFPDRPALKPVPVTRPKERTVKIILDENENIPPTGQFFGINGKSYILKAGVEAEVPIGILDVLDHAIEAKAIIDPLTRRVVGHTTKRRYSYQRVATERERRAREQDANEAS